MTEKNYLAMSDEEFMQLPERVNGVAEEATPEPDKEEPVVEEQPVAEEHQEQPVQEEQQEEAKEEPKAEEGDEPPVKTGDEAKAASEAEEPTKQEEEAKAETPDYEGFYNKIIAPIKANGRTIEIKSVDDAIRLMQMGAGFGRKMQDIQPHLKTLRFLEQNHLLNVDQAELAYLVDLRNKNPDAIKKLVKDAGIDPLDFSSEEPVNYKTNIQPVTDKEVVFKETLSDISAQEGGQETINVCYTSWDAESHMALMNDPELIRVIHEQRQLGIYDRIVNEMDRQKALGRIPTSTPFLQAYKQVGDFLKDNNGFADLAPKERAPVVQPEPKQPQLIETRVIAPKPSVSNNDKAKAAASTKTSARKAAPTINPLAMSDEEFEKQYGNKY